VIPVRRSRMLLSSIVFAIVAALSCVMTASTTVAAVAADGTTLARLSNEPAAQAARFIAVAETASHEAGTTRVISGTSMIEDLTYLSEHPDYVSTLLADLDLSSHQVGASYLVKGLLESKDAVARTMWQVTYSDRVARAASPAPADVPQPEPTGRELAGSLLSAGATIAGCATSITGVGAVICVAGVVGLILFPPTIPGLPVAFDGVVQCTGDQGCRIDGALFVSKYSYDIISYDFCVQVAGGQGPYAIGRSPDFQGPRCIYTTGGFMTVNRLAGPPPVQGGVQSFYESKSTYSALGTLEGHWQYYNCAKNFIAYFIVQTTDGSFHRVDTTRGGASQEFIPSNSCYYR